jgi:nucleoside-triphosphatase THEP1
MSDHARKSEFVITGATGSGKTTFLLRLVDELQHMGVSLGGFAAVSDPQDAPSGSYHIRDLVFGKTLPLASRKFRKGWESCGNFFFNPEGMLLGEEILENTLIAEKDLIVVDEVGPFELDGRIWAGPITRLLDRRTGSILLVVRATLVDKVLERWNLEAARVLDIGQTTPEQAANEIGFLTRKEGN